MLELVNKLHEKLPERFIKGTLIKEGFRDDGLNEFKFLAEDPNNKFAQIEKDFVPTSYLLGDGQIQPNKSLYHEDGAISVAFSIYVNEDFEQNYSDIKQFNRDLAGDFGEIEGYKYAVNPSPIINTGNQIVNGKRVVMLEFQIFYQITDKGFLGNFRTYEIRPLFLEELNELEAINEEPDEMEQPPFTDILTFEYLPEIDGYKASGNKAHLTNGTLSIPPTHDDGVNGEKPVKIFDGQFHQVSQAPSFENPYLFKLWTSDNLEEFNFGVFINEITKENVRIGKNIKKLPTAFLANNQIEGTYKLPDHIEEIGSNAFGNADTEFDWPENDITTFMMGKSINAVAGRFIARNANIEEVIIFNETPPSNPAGAGKPLNEAYTNTIYVPKNAVEDYKNTVAWGDYEVKPLLEANNYSSVSNIIKTLDYTDEEKEDLIYRIEYNKELTEEEINLLNDLTVEASYKELVRIESNVGLGNDNQPIQRIAEREVSMIKGHSVFSKEFSIYKKDDFFNADLDALEGGTEPLYNVYVLRLKENEQVKYERTVMLEAYTSTDEVGDIIYRRITLRKADQLLIDKELARFDEE